MEFNKSAEEVISLSQNDGQLCNETKMPIRSKRVLDGTDCSIFRIDHYAQVVKKRKVSERKETDMSIDHQDQLNYRNTSAYGVLEIDPCSNGIAISSEQLPIDESSPAVPASPVLELMSARNRDAAVSEVIVQVPDVLVLGITGAQIRNVPTSEVAQARIPDSLVPELASTWIPDVPIPVATGTQTLDACSTSADSNFSVTESQLDTNKEEVCAEVRRTTGMNAFDELRAFDAVKLAEKMSMKDEEFIGWLTDLKLVPRGRICDCGFEMRVYLSPEFDKQQWKCRRNACRRSKGLYTNTFFHNWRLPVKHLFKLSYYWCFGELNIQRLRDEFRKNGGRVPTHQTVLSFNAFLRGVCSGYFRLNPLQLGGEGIYVSIEKILITREPPTTVGAVSKEHWGFCGAELGSNVCFIEEVDEELSSSLSSSSLLMIIDRYIRPGTMTVSTLWKKYEVNGELPEAFKRLAKQRSIRFIEAENERRENYVHTLWNKFKRIQYKGLDRTPLICAYIKEFMWRQLFGGDDCMYHLWSHIASMYPL